MTAVSTPLIELLNRLEAGPGFTLTFLRHNPTGRVHVIVPGDPDADTPDLAWRQAALEAVKPVPTVCGYEGRRDGAIGEPDPVDEPVGSFPDGALCGACRARLGPWQSRAFEHPTEDLTGQHVRRAQHRTPRAWDATHATLKALPHATPILRRGRLQAGIRRDGQHDHAGGITHIAVVSHHSATGGSYATLAAACNTRLRLGDTHLRPAASLHSSRRCGRPACAALFRQAATR